MADLEGARKAQQKMLARIAEIERILAPRPLPPWKPLGPNFHSGHNQRRQLEEERQYYLAEVARYDRIIEVSEERAPEYVGKVRKSAERDPGISEDVQSKLSDPSKFPLMRTNEVASALGRSKSAFYRNRSKYKRLKAVKSGLYRTVSVIDQLDNLPSKW